MKRIAAWIGALMGVTAAADTPAAKGPEQAVIVHFTYGSTDLTALFELEERLEAVIAAARVGEYDGNEVAVDGSDGYLYMYGPDADKLFEVVRPILQQAAFMKGAEVRKRYGRPSEDVRQQILKIEP